MQARRFQVQERRVQSCELFHLSRPRSSTRSPPYPQRRPLGVRHLRAMSENGAMLWASVYLAVSVVGALLVVNAFRPARHQLLAVPSFFAGWYTAEMPLWHIAWQVAATVAFALEGAFGSWPGWVGLAV